MKARYISTTETAKIIRVELAKAFPGIKFSVTSDKYSGGSSVNVKWIDGPTMKQVEAVAGKFHGASFDGMQDLKSYHDTEYNGEVVSFSADYVFFCRSHSQEFLQKVAEKTAPRLGVAVPGITVSTHGSIQGVSNERVHDGFSLNEMIYRDACKTFFFEGMRCTEKR